MKGFVGNGVPKVDAGRGRRLMEAVTAAIRGGLVRSCHDCSEGGLAVALAEMAFAGGLGMDIGLSGLGGLADEAILFSESNTRFILEVENDRAFARAMKGVPLFRLGRVVGGNSFRITAGRRTPAVDTTIQRLKEAWQKTFRGM
jgi:phosphoribosylformylglycinamidine synthase